jgi:hypothetical protein
MDVPCVRFCEAPFSLVTWVREFVNTISSFAYVWVGCAFLYRIHCADTPSSPLWFQRMQMLGIWIVCIGVGSMAFHAVPSFATECADEIPMVLCMLTLFRITIDQNAHMHPFVSTQNRRDCIYAVVCACTIVSMVIYIVVRQYVFFLYPFTWLVTTSLCIEWLGGVNWKTATWVGGWVVLGQSLWQIEQYLFSTYNYSGVHCYWMHGAWHLFSAYALHEWLHIL